MSNTAQWITLLTVIAGFVYQAWRENRQRRWDKEDRKELAQKLADDRVALADIVRVEAKHVADLAVTHNEKLSDAIQANTEISTQAFKEANTVNLKLEALGLEHNALQREKQADDKAKR